MGPLSAELNRKNGLKPVQRNYLKPGEWAILLIQPCYGERESVGYIQRKLEKDGRVSSLPLEKVSYALVSSPKSPGSTEYQAIDMPTFLRNMGMDEANEVFKWWKCRVENGAYLEFYGKEDVQDILHKIYQPFKGNDEQNSKEDM